MSAADRGLTNALRSFRSNLSGLTALNGTYGRRREDAASELRFALKRFGRDDLDAEDILDDLLEQKVVYLVKGVIRPASRVVKRTREESQAAYDQFVDTVAERATEDAEGRRLLKVLIRRMARLHGVHRISGADGPGIFVSTAMDFISGQPTTTKGVAAVYSPRGLKVFNVSAERIRLEWNGDWPIFGIDFSDLNADNKATKEIRGVKLVGSGGIPLVGASYQSASALRRLHQRREDIESFIGLTLDGHKWNGLRMSLRGGKHLGRMIQRSLLGILDPEIRRIALRNPFATHAFYQWIKTGSRETIRRRSQMSEEYPFFTSLMPKLDETIRNGEPLLPALAKVSGLDIPRVKRLRGVHWQRLGGTARELIDPDDGGEYSTSRTWDLMKIEPERLPASRNEWSAWSRLVNWPILEHLPEERRQAARNAISRNWLGYHDLHKKDFAQALSDTAENLVTLIDHHVSTGKRQESATKVLKGAILRHVAGDNFGLKRLRLFNEAWHKGAGQRAVELREIRKKVFGEERIAKWNPLTEGVFKCEAGRLVWMTDELELLEEGKRMNHCVASYWSHCVDGRSHIAQVHATDGTRSTVEFGIDGRGRLSVSQHHTYGDKAPSGTCATVVSKFMVKHRQTKFEVSMGDRGNRLDEERRAIVSEDLVVALKNAYSNCLPVAFLETVHARGRLWMGANPDVCLEVAESARQVRAEQIRYRNLRGAAIPVPGPITF
jgi:hypothetical protein